MSKSSEKTRSEPELHRDFLNEPLTREEIKALRSGKWSLPSMSLDQEGHLLELQAYWSKRLDAKYRKGQREHGGNMWEKPGMLYCLMDECTDFLAYAWTVADQIKEWNPELYDFLMTPGKDDE